MLLPPIGATGTAFPYHPHCPEGAAFVRSEVGPYAQGVQQPGHPEVEGGCEGQLDASSQPEVLGQRGVDFVGNVLDREGVGEGEGGPPGVVEGGGGAPLRELGDPVLLHAGLRGHAPVLWCHSYGESVGWAVRRMGGLRSGGDVSHCSRSAHERPIRASSSPGACATSAW